MGINVKENIQFVGSNSRESLLNLYIPENRAKSPLLIFLHGFKGFKDWGQFPLICETIARKGIAVLSFNFSHNGGTVEQPIDFPDLVAFSENTCSKELDDVSLILKWIVEHQSTYLATVDTGNISILGHSRGGGIAVLAAANHSEIKSVITWASVSDYKQRLPNAEELKKWKENGVYIIKNGRTKQDMPMRYSFVEDLLANEDKLLIKAAAKKLEIPHLIVHGSKDETVSLQEGLQLAEWSKAAKLIVIEEGDHTFGGYHPYSETSLPKATRQAVEESVKFLKD